MSYQPAEKLTNRTFVGLIIAQFLAGFNDQAIHAAAMFYTIHTRILPQASAITLMPILFYAPWAIFCTLAGYYADRYSKTMTLRIWKVSEIAIALLLTAGFYLGTNEGMLRLGGWLVMSCVFMMGTHAAFFAPAKYGAMPEILRPHILSRGNGVLESTTFLASILGTVAGGLLFELFRDREVWIGIILLVLSVIGAGASFMIVWLPAASPDRAFPCMSYTTFRENVSALFRGRSVAWGILGIPYQVGRVVYSLFQPLIQNLKVMFRSRPLALAVLGIAFFVFMVSYMRASMYMHGETRNPRWDAHYTSLIVATVALGVGLGSPLAGYFSGGKVELGLVPLGCLGMIVALIAAAIAIEHTVVLVIALIIIGFFSGFYMVPLYTLLQQRAPKKSKGELVATSNFINVTGAIAASLLFGALVKLSIFAGWTPEITVVDETLGTLTRLVSDKHNKLIKVNVQKPDGTTDRFRANTAEMDVQDLDSVQRLVEVLAVRLKLEPADRVIDFDEHLFDVLSGTPQIGDEVIVSTYTVRHVQHFLIRRADQPQNKIYDNEILPRFLFIGAALMTTIILFLLYRKLPDFFVRSLFWFKSLRKFRLKAVGMEHLPTEGPVILATNCRDMQSCLQLVSATDRSTQVILALNGEVLHDGPLLRWLAEPTSIFAVRPGPDCKISWTEAIQQAEKTLKSGNLLAISVANPAHAAEIEGFLNELLIADPAPVVPVYCGALVTAVGRTPRVRVVFGAPLATPLSLDDCNKAVDRLGEWIRENDKTAGTEQH